MLELNARSFLSAVTELRHLIVLIDAIEDQAATVRLEIRTGVLAGHVGRLSQELSRLNARSALAPVNRLRLRLEDHSLALTYKDVRSTLSDIESRFSDHLDDIKLFVLNEQESSLFEPADNLLGSGGSPVEGFSRAYPNASFEFEEAAKSLALGRSTACVFHCMRVLEHGIKAICKLLKIPDATKPADKSWGVILKAIKGKLDELYPNATRVPGSRGAKLEALYVTLDAIKNPWRNATMHVENIYAPHEALHIARCSGVFMLELLKHCDEEGIASEDSPANATVGESTPSADVSAAVGH